MTHLETLRAINSLRGRAKALKAGHAYEIEERKGQFGLDVIMPDAPRVDESRMGIWIPFADGNKRDGVGDLLEVEGIDLSRHKANPIVLYDHGKQVTLPIALASDPDSEQYTVEIDGLSRTAGAMSYFYQGKGVAGVGREDEYSHGIFCEQLFDLMVRKYVRGGSIGYTVIAAREIAPDYDRGIPKGLHLMRVKMLELSAVVLPCNQDTVGKGFVSHDQGMQDAARRILGMGKVCGSPLSSVLVKSLTPFVGEKKAVLGYEASAMHKSATEPKKTPEPDKPYHKDMKELRKQYRAKARMARTENTTDYQPGGKVAAREILTTWDGTRPTTFARPGDKLTIVSVSPSGRIEVENSAGRRDSYSSAHLRKIKSLSGASPTKPTLKPAAKGVDFKALRKKYRHTKHLRRRLKKSSPGSSVAVFRSKDVEAVRDAAAKASVKLKWLGEYGQGLQKATLTGDDAAIDGIANQYGQPMGMI